MKKSQFINFSMPEYWEKSYQSGDMSWDLGRPTPIFDDWIQYQTDSLSICVLGAGNGWDAMSFAEKGHNVTAVDFAESAINNMHAFAQERGVQINLIHSDIFDLDKLFTHTFDVVLEYTCFCAIDPERRLDYVRITKQILKANGKLVGIFFPVDKNIYTTYMLLWEAHRTNYGNISLLHYEYLGKSLLLIITCALGLKYFIKKMAG